MKFKAENIRKDFPILEKNVTYLDNACMTLKPQQVIDAVNEYYTSYTACTGRSMHSFAEEVATRMDVSRCEVQKFIRAKHSSEIVFTKNTTEGINLLAHSLQLDKGDEVIISDREHNSNLIPWLRLKNKGVKVVVAETGDDGSFDIESFEKKFTQNTKLVSFVHTSNLDGVTYPIKDIAKIAHEHGALVAVDGAQGVPSYEIDVKKLNVDFLCFSGHKMLGPTGTGVFYGKKDCLETLEPLLVGGGTVVDSTYEGYTLEKSPLKFEAGLQDYAGLIGLQQAVSYLSRIGLDNIHQHMVSLNKIVTEGLPSVQLFGPKDAEQRGGIFSFIIPGVDVHHVAKMLNTSKIMVRSGAHCVHSWFNKHNLEGNVRASMYLYNTEEDVLKFVEELKKIIRVVS